MRESRRSNVNALAIVRAFEATSIEWNLHTVSEHPIVAMELYARKFDTWHCPFKSPFHLILESHMAIWYLSLRDHSSIYKFKSYYVSIEADLSEEVNICFYFYIYFFYIYFYYVKKMSFFMPILCLKKNSTYKVITFTVKRIIANNSTMLRIHQSILYVRKSPRLCSLTPGGKRL